MKINALFLATRASVVDERLWVEDAAWDGLSAESFPAAHAMQVVLLLAPDEADLGVDVATALAVVGADGESAGSIAGNIHIVGHREQVPVVLPLSATFPAEGDYRVVASVGAAQTSISLALTTQAPTTQVFRLT